MDQTIISIFETKKWDEPTWSAKRKLIGQYLKRVRQKKAELKEQGYSGDKLNRKLNFFREQERQKEQEGVQDGRKKLSLSDKKTIHSYMRKTGLLKAVNMKNPKVELPENLKPNNFCKYVASNNFFFIFPILENKQENTFFDCILIPGNFAWISKSHSGQWRYYSKIKNGRSVGLNLFDLVQIVTGDLKGTKNSVFFRSYKLVAELLEAPFVKTERKQIQKYEKNIQLLESEVTKMKSEYPTLYKVIKSSLCVLRQINLQGKGHIHDGAFFEGESIFFVSNRYLGELVGKHPSVVNRSINLLCLLGFLKKIRLHQLPQHIANTAKRQKEKNGYASIIGFYTIPLYDIVLLANAEKVAIQLKRYKVKEVSCSIVEQIFGVKVAIEVYGDYGVYRCDLGQSLRNHLLYDGSVDNWQSGIADFEY
jgi:hypothetical protein